MRDGRTTSFVLLIPGQQCVPNISEKGRLQMGGLVKRMSSCKSSMTLMINCTVILRNSGMQVVTSYYFKDKTVAWNLFLFHLMDIQLHT